VIVTIDSDHYRATWTAGTGPAAPVNPGSGLGQYGDYLPLGNSVLDVKGGYIRVTSLFAMAGQDPSYGGGSGYGTATFHTGGELNMGGGSFFNMNMNDFQSGAGGSLGIITIDGGGIVSGSGYIYAGEQFRVQGGTIAPGSRHMYDFERGDAVNKLTSLGTLHIYDRDDVPTLFNSATFRTELDRGTQPDNSDGLSDHAIVYGELQIDPRFIIDISRPLDGEYLLVQTSGTGNYITSFTPRSLNGLTASGDELLLNLNGKLVKGNDRIDYAGGLFTTIENGNTEIWLTVNTTSDGNVITYWTGNAITETLPGVWSDALWSMTARNFRARNVENTADAVFSGSNQFLDGDIVYFDYLRVTDDDPDKQKAMRTVTVVEAPHYVGDTFWYKPADNGNVRVAEVNVIGGTSADIFEWRGGSIYALDSALHSTLDKVTTGETPSGRFNKIGYGVLEIHNANEFYGGIHLGKEGGGIEGGLIQLYNEKGLGTYNSATGLQEKGLVYVHENSTIQLMDDKMVLNNRFIVDPGKVLTFMFGTEFTIAGNNALASGAARGGRGGGMFIGDEGRIVYMGSGSLIVRNNQASAGGGIYTELGYTLQVPAYIKNNYASGQGGGIYAEQFFELKDGSEIVGNKAQSRGGGIYVGNVGTLTGGPEFIIHGNSQITNNRSGGTTGGGVYVDAGRVLVIDTKSSTGSTLFGGGDVWFEGNKARIGFDPDNPISGAEDDADAIRNALHLANTASGGDASEKAKLLINGPYNTYFYDPISGDTGTLVTIQGVPAGEGDGGNNAVYNSSGVWTKDDIFPRKQYGTVIFHGDSEYYGSTKVLDGATFRLENSTDYIDVDDNPTGAASYGLRGSLEGEKNTFTLGVGSWITGQGTIAADNIILGGNLNLDTATFSRPGTRDGSGVLKDTLDNTVPAGFGLGILNLDGDVTIEDTSAWYLTIGAGGLTDLVDVTGSATFTGTTDGKKMEFFVDDIFREKYAVLTASSGIENYYKDDAPIKFDIAGTWVDLVQDNAPPFGETYFDLFGRMRATSYVEVDPVSGFDTLYLDIGARNRHVTLTANSNWGYNDAWTFAGAIPTPTGTVFGNWIKHDIGPDTLVYLDGDMVTISGDVVSNVVLTTNVRPVDLFVDGISGKNVTISGAHGISTYSTTQPSSTTTSYNGPNDTTITTNAANNDYGILGYTGKLHKSGENTLTFSNTGANLFTMGIEFNTGGANAGVISFNRVNQLTVGAGRTIDFLESGTLHYTGASATLVTAAASPTGTNIRIEGGKTATFNIASTSSLTVSGVISNISGNGAIEKIGAGTLVLSRTNTFAGGTTFREGTIEIRNNAALGTYATSPANTGLVDVRGTGTKNLFVNSANYTIRNRFDVSSGGDSTNALNINITSGRTLTIDNGNIATLANGGAIHVAAGQGQLTFGSSPTYGGALTIRNNTAQSGGGIYSAVITPLTFTGATSFVSNYATAGSGGGLYNAGNVIFQKEATLRDNTAQTSGGAIHATGNVTFNEEATLTGNTAQTSGGAIYATGNVTFDDETTLTGNTATNGSGGAIWAETSTVSLTGTGDKTIQDNTANMTSGYGGAIYARNINLSVSEETIISGNQVAYGGVFAIADSAGGLLTLNTGIGAAGGDIIFRDNTAGEFGDAIYLGTNGNVNITAGDDRTVWFDNNTLVSELMTTHTLNKYGEGLLAFTGVGANNVFRGVTNVNEGEFRVAGSINALGNKIDQTFYGYADGTTFKLYADGVLSGGGTLTASTTEVLLGERTGTEGFHLWGIVAPDSNTEAMLTEEVPFANRIGTLTFNGDVTMYGGSGPYQYQVHLEAPASAVYGEDAWKTTGRSDLISVNGNFYAEIGTAVDSDGFPIDKIIVDVHNFGIGKFLLIEATDLLVTRDGVIQTIADSDLDGIDYDGAFDLRIHEGYLTNRHQVAFARGDEKIYNYYALDPSLDWVYANDAYNDVQDATTLAKAQNELWLATQTYNLLMYWTGKNDGDGLANVWQGTDSDANGNWREWKANTASKTPETHFMQSDSVVFADFYPDYPLDSGEFDDDGPIGRRAITINGLVRVTNMLVDSTGAYSFAGTGGIRTTSDYAGDELDDLYDEGLLFVLSEQLIKMNTGTLTFTNTGGNNFAEGIVFDVGPYDSLPKYTNAGTIQFSRADQLGDWNEDDDENKGITFLESGTLQATTALTFANNLHIAHGKTATFTGTVAVTHTGKIDEIGAADTGNFAKTGTGTLTLNNATSGWQGTTTISGGTLVAVGVGAPNDTSSLGMNTATRTITVTGAATTNLRLQIDGAASETLKQRITGIGRIEKTGTGTLTLDRNDNDHTGGTTVATGGGTLIGYYAGSFGRNVAPGDSGNIINNAALVYDMHDTGIAYNTISGAGTFTKRQTLTGGQTNNYLTLQSIGNTFSGAITVTGGAAGTPNYLIANDSRSLGGTTSLASTTRTINLAGQYDYLRINENAVSTNAIANTITGAGRLEKTGSFTTTLSGTNTFTGGTDLQVGGLTLTNVAALGTAYTGGTAGSLDATDAGTKTVTFNSAGTFQNHFHVIGGTLVLATGQNTTIGSANNHSGDGGAVLVDTGQTLQLNNVHALTFSGNSDQSGSNDIYLDGTGAQLEITGTGNTFIGSGIAGSGSVTKTAASTGITQIGADSVFDGTTTIAGGTFRVVQGISYGTEGSGTFSQTAATSTVEGGGTIKADQINLAGRVSPDSATLNVGSPTVANANRFGTLTLDGAVDLASTFIFDYNAGTPIASNTITPIGYGTPTGDLIKMQNGDIDNYVIHEGATVNFRETLVSGKYLIFIANEEFKLLDGGGIPTAVLDGIKASGVTKATFESTENHTPRGGFEFVWGTSDVDASGAPINDIMSQIWLNVNRNTLEMTWKDVPFNTTWVSAAGGSNFTSTQSFNDGLIDIYEQVFNNGDYVIFDTKGTAQSINIGTGGVIVSGMNVNAGSNYTFTGNGITAYVTHDTIEGDYIPGGALYATAPQVNPDGKLQKSGTGTLTFANGANRFHKGIEIAGGTIAFSNANQLNTLDTDDTTDNAIRFIGTSTLQANATGQDLTNKIIIDAGQTANIYTQAHELTLSGQITGAGALTKATGTNTGGTLILSNYAANDYTGTTTINTGTLRALGLGSNTALGNNVAAHQVSINGATSKLQLQVGNGTNASASATLNQLLTGTGHVEKIGLGEQILTHTANTYSGGTTVTAGTLTGQYVGSFGTGTITNNAALEYDMHAAGTATNFITGAGTFTKTQHGGSFDLTLDNTSNDFSGGIAVTGTGAAINRLVANDSQSLGAIDSTTRSITLDRQYDYLRINENTQNNTINNTITGGGGLEKAGAFTTTLTGNNTFGGGTDLQVGTISLGHNNALGTYTGSGTAGELLYTGNNTTVLSTTAGRTTTNRFVAATGVTGAKLEATANLTLQQTAGTNAIIEVGPTAGMIVDANGGSITFVPHATNTAADVTMAAGSALTLNTENVTDGIFINSGIAGLGSVTKTGVGIVQIAAYSDFDGTTTIEDGIFRVVQNQIYGEAGTFTLETGTVSPPGNVTTGAVLAGQGTIKADTILLQGVLTPDAATFVAGGSTTIPSVDRFGILTFDGEVTLNGFTMTYHESTPKTTKETDANINTGDLLRILGDAPTLVGGTIDIQHVSLDTGWYLIAESEMAFDLDGGILDGITGGGVLHLTRNGGQPVNTASPRNWYKFEFGENEIGDKDTRIWLHADTNSLTMDWQMGGDGIWAADSMVETNWKSEQFNLDAGIPQHSLRFRQGDYVRFNVTGNTTIEITNNNTIVSGFNVDGNFDTTFTDNPMSTESGGIHAMKEHPTWIIGKYLPGGSDYNNPWKLDPDGELRKSGIGMLTFANTGGNLFDEGIFFVVEIGAANAGIIAFNNANQLGDGGKGITFNESGTLQANAIIASLTNELKIAHEKTATFNTNGNNVSHTGKIDEIGAADTGNFVKTGGGTLTLNNANSGWQGTTTVSDGTLVAIGVGSVGGTGSLGMNVAARTITVTGANLTLQIAATETLKQRIAGSGSVTKTDAGTLTLDHNNDYTGGTTISGGKIIAETLNAVGSNVATGIVSTAANTALELKLETGEGGTFHQQITGSGKLIKSGDTPSTLTLSRTDNNYTGGTDINSGRITITHVGAVGSNVAAGVVNMIGANTSLELALTADSTFNQLITGVGQLVKTGTMAATLTNANTFTGGTELAAGTLILNDAEALNKTGTVAGSNQGFVFVTGDATVAAGSGVTAIQNRFEASAGQLTINSLDITGNDINGVNGGAIELKSGASFVAAIDTQIDLYNNKTTASGGAIYAPTETITIGGSGTNTINSLTNNVAGVDGGGIYAQAVNVNGGQTITGNTAGGQGGALYLVGGTPGTPAISTLDANGSDIVFTGNRAGTTNNAIYMNENATLNLIGNKSIYLNDGIASNNTGVRGNVITINMANNDDLNNVVYLQGRSAYYGNTEFEKGLLKLEGAHFGATASNGNTFKQYSDAILYGTGTVEASTILLGGTLNAGIYTWDPRTSEIETLNFVGATRIGDLRSERLGVTTMYIDLNPTKTQQADLIDVTGTLTLVGNTANNRTLNDLDTSANGKFLIARTTGGVLDYTSSGLTEDGRLEITDNFDTLVAGKEINTYRFNVYYTLENDGKDIYLNVDLKSSLTSGQLVWNSLNANVTGSTTWDNDDYYKNKWVNGPTFNWENQDDPLRRELRNLQRDRVVFDSVADKDRDEWEMIRKNIEIITHEDDTYAKGDTTGDSAPATVRDMLVLNGGTYRFTGLGINGVFDEIHFADTDEYKGGQLFVSTYSTVLFDNEANNFQRGIDLQKGAIGFSNVDQLGTSWEDDPENGGKTTTRGILVSGDNSYGLLYVNANDMTLRTPIVIEESDSEFIVNTDGNAFGNDAPYNPSDVRGKYNLTIAHLNDGTVPATGIPNGISGEGKLVKEGEGTLTLADENYYKGGTDILGGTIAVAANNRLGISDSRVKLDDGTLQALESFATVRKAELGDEGGTLEADAEKQLTWTGLITGTGGLTTTGLGTVVLSNTANDYEGNTTVANGRLVATGIETLGENIASRSITTTLLDPDTNKRSILELQLADSGTLGQTLLGNGEVRKTGTGDLTLAQDSDGFTGRFNFSQGNVYLNAEFKNSDSFLVGTGTTLYGTGWLGSLGSEGGVIRERAQLIPNGVVADDPNVDPTATFLNISGNLTFEKQSLYQVVITQYADSTYDPVKMRPINDKIVVDAGGVVKIDEGAELNVTIDYWADTLSPFDFGATTSDYFTIIDAAAGSVDPDTKEFFLHDVELPRGIELMHGWNGSLYQLWFLGDPAGLFAGIGSTHNQKEIGKILDYLTQTKDPGMQELVRILSQKEISDDMVRGILSQLSGDLRANSVGMTLKMPWRAAFNRVDRDMFPRVFDPCQPITCRPEYNYEKEFWVEWYGRHSNFRHDGNSYANTVRREGIVIGFDQRVCDFSLFGAVFNYSEPKQYQATGRTKADDFEIGIYNLTKLSGAFDLKSYFGYSYQDYDLRRRVSIPEGGRYDAVYDTYRNKTHGDTFAMSFELIRPMDYNDYITFAPLLALDYERVWQKGYTEAGGLTALRYDSTTLERTMMRFGMNTKVLLHNRLDLLAKIQYATQLNRTEYPRSGAHFVNATVANVPTADIRGSRVGRDHLNVGIGGTYYLDGARATSFTFGYDADMWRRMASHTGNIGYTHRW